MAPLSVWGPCLGSHGVCIFLKCRSPGVNRDGAGCCRTQPHLTWGPWPKGEGAEGSEPLPAAKHCYYLQRTLPMSTKFGFIICFPHKCSSLFCFPFGSAQVLIWYLETGVRHKLLKSFLCALPIIEKVLTLFYFKTEEVLFDHQIYKTRLFSTQTVSGVKALLLNDIVSFIVHFFKHWTLETYMPQETCYPKKEQLKIQAVISSFKTWHLEMEYALLCNPFAFCCIVQWRKVQHHFGQGHIYSRIRYFNSFWVFTPWFLSITNTFRAALVAETAQNPRFNPS